MTEITVTDSTHPTHLVAELVALRNDGEMFDYIIKGSNESFSIHSVVLAAMSPVFRSMVRSDMKESAKKEATFPSIPDDIIAKIISFSYAGTCTFTRAQVIELVKAAHYLQMPKLLKLCEEQISAVLEPCNCISWWQLANRLELKIVVPEIKAVMQTKFKEIITTEGFKELEVAELAQYLSDAREYWIQNDDLVQGVLQWIQHDSPTRSGHVNDLLHEADVGKCTETFLRQVIQENTDLLENQLSTYKLMLTKVLNKASSKVLGDKMTVLILGGQSYDVSPNSEGWILKQDEIEKLCELTEDKVQPYHSIREIPGGMMLTGGEHSKLCMMFILSMKMWVKHQELKSSRWNHGSGYNNGKVLVIGGEDGYFRYDGTGSFLSSIDVMAIDKNHWSTGPALPNADSFPRVITFNSKLFVLMSGNSSLYELKGEDTKMSWCEKSPMPESSEGCSMAVADDKIFAAGGGRNINYMYTPSTDQWCRLTGPSLKDNDGSLVYYEQKLYVFCGCASDETLKDVEVYDIKTDKWFLSKWKLPKPLKGFHAFIIDTSK